MPIFQTWSNSCWFVSRRKNPIFRCIWDGSSEKKVCADNLPGCLRYYIILYYVIYLCVCKRYFSMDFRGFWSTVRGRADRDLTRLQAEASRLSASSCGKVWGPRDRLWVFLVLLDCLRPWSLSFIRFYNDFIRDLLSKHIKTTKG